MENLSTEVRSDVADQSEVFAPQEDNVGQLHKFVSFYLGDTQYALPAKDVAEVTGHLTPTPLPDSPENLLGIASHRGDILGVVRVGEEGSGRTAAKDKSVVLRPTGSVEMPIAFNVDRLGELLHINTADIYSATSPDPHAEFETMMDGRPVFIIEPARLIESLVRP